MVDWTKIGILPVSDGGIMELEIWMAQFIMALTLAM